MQETPIPQLKSTPAFYKGTHRYSFRNGERAEIIGVRIVITQYGSRPCFMVLYPDGFIDYTLISEADTYIIEGPL